MSHGLHVPGHFGEWLQGRLGPAGPVVLVTLPAPGLGLSAVHRPGRGLRVTGAGLSPERARKFLARLGLGLRGAVRLRPQVAPGLGTGVSTASLVALARLAGWDGRAEDLARACVAAEGASDPLMFAAPERILWASRRAEVVQALPPLPRCEILGGFHGAPARTEAADQDFPDVSDLVTRWCGAQDLAGFAAIASESAARCTAWRGPSGEDGAALAARLGALGWMRAHTGAARGLIFAPGCVPAGAGAMLRGAGWRGVVRIEGGSR